MITRRYPVLLWTDAAGQHGGALAAEFDSTAATAATEEEVLRQLRELIEWNIEHEPWLAEPDLIEATLIEVRVDVRPNTNPATASPPAPRRSP